MYLTIKEFDRQVRVAIPYLRNNMDKFPEISNARLLELEEMLAQWIALYAIYQDPTKKTTVVVHDLNVLLKSFDKKYRKMQQIIKVGGNANQEDLVALFIHIDEAPHPIGTPKDIPVVDIVSKKRETFTIQISTVNLPEFNHRTLPKDVALVTIYTANVAAGDEKIPEEKDYRVFTTAAKATIVLHFDQSEVGSKVFIKAVFQNAKGMPGTVSKATDGIISD